jgi:hypothetical protein
MDGLNGIQWNSEPGVGSPVEWLDAFHRIKGMGFCLYVACDTIAEAKTLVRALGPDGLFIVLPPFEEQTLALQAISEIASCC